MLSDSAVRGGELLPPVLLSCRRSRDMVQSFRFLDGIFLNSLLRTEIYFKEKRFEI